MTLYEARPDTPGEARGAVIVVQEAFGVNDHIEDVTRRVADAGYHAVAPDLFHRAGGGTVPYGDLPAVMAKLGSVDDDGVLADIDAARAALHGEGFADERIGTVGFCFGGRVTFLVAARRSLGAAVGFYGGGIVSPGRLGFPALVDEAASLQTPWLGLFGDEDASIPVDDVERLRAALEPAPVASDVVRYAGAGHGFHCDARPDAFEPAAAADAWGRTLTWFELHLGATPT